MFIHLLKNKILFLLTFIYHFNLLYPMEHRSPGLLNPFQRQGSSIPSLQNPKPSSRDRIFGRPHTTIGSQTTSLYSIVHSDCLKACETTEKFKKDLETRRLSGGPVQPFRESYPNRFFGDQIYNRTIQIPSYRDVTQHQPSIFPRGPFRSGLKRSFLERDEENNSTLQEGVLSPFKRICRPGEYEELTIGKSTPIVPDFSSRFQLNPTKLEGLSSSSNPLIKKYGSTQDSTFTKQLGERSSFDLPTYGVRKCSQDTPTTNDLEVHLRVQIPQSSDNNKTTLAKNKQNEIGIKGSVSYNQPSRTNVGSGASISDNEGFSETSISPIHRPYIEDALRSANLTGSQIREAMDNITNTGGGIYLATYTNDKGQTVCFSVNLSELEKIPAQSSSSTIASPTPTVSPMVQRMEKMYPSSPKPEKKKDEAKAAEIKAKQQEAKKIVAEKKKLAEAKRAAAKRLLERAKLQKQREEQEIKAARKTASKKSDMKTGGGELVGDLEKSTQPCPEQKDNVSTSALTELSINIIGVGEETIQLTQKLDLCFDLDGNIKIPTDQNLKEIELEFSELDRKVQTAIFSLAKIGFDSTVPGGERFRKLLGSSLGISDQLTKEEFLKNLAQLPVDVIVDAFIRPKVINGLINGIKNIGKIRKVAGNFLEILKESKSVRETAQKVVSGTKAATLVSKEGSLAGTAQKVVNPATGTVWDYITNWGPMYNNMKIPKYFELTVKGQKFWVAPNATEHMMEYLRDRVSHGIEINSQSLLESFKVAVEKALELKTLYTDKPIIIGCWELMFSPSRNNGLLPAIKHAVYKP